MTNKKNPNLIKTNHGQAGPLSVGPNAVTFPLGDSGNGFTWALVVNADLINVTDINAASITVTDLYVDNVNTDHIVSIDITNSDFIITDTLTVENHTDLQGTLDVALEVTVEGRSEFNKDVHIKGTAGNEAELSVDGTAYLNHNLLVQGAANLSNTLSVQGKADFQNDVEIAQGHELISDKIDLRFDAKIHQANGGKLYLEDSDVPARSLKHHVRWYQGDTAHSDAYNELPAGGIAYIDESNYPNLDISPDYPGERINAAFPFRVVDLYASNYSFDVDGIHVISVEYGTGILTIRDRNTLLPSAEFPSFTAGSAPFNSTKPDVIFCDGKSILVSTDANLYSYQKDGTLNWIFPLGDEDLGVGVDVCGTQTHVTLQASPFTGSAHLFILDDSGTVIGQKNYLYADRLMFVASTSLYIYTLNVKGKLQCYLNAPGANPYLGFNVHWDIQLPDFGASSVVTGLECDGTNVYATWDNHIAVFELSPEIYGVGSSSDPTQVYGKSFPDNYIIDQLTLDQTFVYIGLKYDSGNNTQLYRLDKRSRTWKVISEQQEGTTGLVSDGQNLFWSFIDPVNGGSLIKFFPRNEPALWTKVDFDHTHPTYLADRKPFAKGMIPLNMVSLSNNDYGDLKADEISVDYISSNSSEIFFKSEVVFEENVEVEKDFSVVGESILNETTTGNLNVLGNLHTQQRNSFLGSNSVNTGIRLTSNSLGPLVSELSFSTESLSPARTDDLTQVTAMSFKPTGALPHATLGAREGEALHTGNLVKCSGFISFSHNNSPTVAARVPLPSITGYNLASVTRVDSNGDPTTNTAEVAIGFLVTLVNPIHAKTTLVSIVYEDLVNFHHKPADALIVPFVVKRYFDPVDPSLLTSFIVSATMFTPSYDYTGAPPLTGNFFQSFPSSRYDLVNPFRIHIVCI